ncbi:hypothetical protein D081_1145 [Anaerovibrio sp. JC8]|uniref:Flp family type IVb pilin n=1 Tax=Anaerovibrio sp. JC8 TaxID=1240085 RepID=UPI000A0C142A|nr:hypothetical protein [Anaerovibrio sp. JC8]ORU00051.1 hypothetical protein D081_1145 [Anaerovibrio sp. JC8]
MLMNLRDVRKQKGQGIVEYALLLAFILGIAIAVQGSGLDNAIANTFARVAHALGVETEQERWASMSEADLRAIDNSERLAADKDYLNSIRNNLLGKTKSEIQTMLGTTKNDEILLGTFKFTDDTNSFYTTRGSSGDGETHDLSIFGFSTREEGSSQRYLFSDYALDNAGNTQTKYLGVKAKNLKYTNGVLTDVEIVVNPNSSPNGREAGLTTKK